MIENVFDLIGIDSFAFKPGHLNIFHTGRQAEIWVDSLRVGSLGEVHPSVLRRLDYPHRVFFAEVNLHDLYVVRRLERKTADLPIYPGSDGIGRLHRLRACLLRKSSD